MDDARFWLAAIADSSDDAIVGQNLDGIVIVPGTRPPRPCSALPPEEIIGQPITPHHPAGSHR